MRSPPDDKMTTRASTTTRQRILDAAESLACDAGPSNLSLDAVAAQAGVSKGGLLYHFPSKSKLFEALVEHHLNKTDTALQSRERTGVPNAVVAGYIEQFRVDRACKRPPPASLLAVLLENPGLLAPVRRNQRDFLERIRANATDPELATLAFLVVNALRSMELLGTLVLDEQEIADVLTALETRLAQNGVAARECPNG